MTKSELVLSLAQQFPDLHKRDVERIVSVFFEEISNALIQGDKVTLRGFGTFSVKHRKARTGRNPKTNETVYVPEKFVPAFKMGRKFHDRLNNN